MNVVSVTSMHCSLYTKLTDLRPGCQLVHAALQVYSYYGLQRPSTIEQSGTYAAHSAEQSTQTTGHIKEAGGTKDNVRDELDEVAGRGSARERSARRPPPRKWGTLVPEGAQSNGR